jgi:hypothetical protein
MKQKPQDYRMSILSPNGLKTMADSVQACAIDESSLVGRNKIKKSMVDDNITFASFAIHHDGANLPNRISSN